MPFIRNLYVASLTSTRSDFLGSDSELVVIMNQGGLDVVHRDLGFGGSETGGGKLYRHNISEFRRSCPRITTCASASAATMPGGRA